MHVSPSRRRLLKVGDREGAAGGRRVSSLKKGTTKDTADDGGVGRANMLTHP